jgi:Mn2+/Fe2+ NRAMP family transporter
MRVVVYTQLDVPCITNNGKSPTQETATSNQDPEVQGVEYINMANGWIMRSLGWLIWALITGLNIYLIVMLGMGKS